MAAILGGSLPLGMESRAPPPELSRIPKAITEISGIGIYANGWRYASPQPDGFLAADMATGADISSWLPVLRAQLTHYPPGFLEATGIKAINLVSNLRVGRAWRPVAFTESGLLPIDIAVGDCVFRRRMLHHAIFHFLDQQLGHNEDPEWEALNAAGVSYLPSTDIQPGGYPDYSLGSWSEEVEGMVSRFALRSAAEDKAELFSFLMADPDLVIRRLETDKTLAAKVDLLARRLQLAADPAFDIGSWLLGANGGAPLCPAESTGTWVDRPWRPDVGKVPLPLDWYERWRFPPLDRYAPAQDTVGMVQGIPIVVTRPEDAKNLGLAYWEGIRPTEPLAQGFSVFLQAEYSRYPEGLLLASRIQRFLLGSELVSNWDQSQVTSMFRNWWIYVSVRSIDCRQWRSTAHHELFQALWRAGAELGDSEEWLAIQGGYRHYQNPGQATDFTLSREWSARVPGFVSEYAMNDLLEDRAETFAFMINEPALVAARAASDEVVAAKVAKIRELLERMVPEMDTVFWARLSDEDRSSAPDAGPCIIEALAEQP